jgi:hypothetical protein
MRSDAPRPLNRFANSAFLLKTGGAELPDLTPVPFNSPYRKVRMGESARLLVGENVATLDTDDVVMNLH